MLTGLESGEGLCVRFVVVASDDETRDGIFTNFAWSCLAAGTSEEGYAVGIDGLRLAVADDGREWLLLLDEMLSELGLRE
jgi:hypothetical protein